MKIIGITGYPGSGKSTFAGILAAKLCGIGHRVLIDSFAGPVKARVRAEGWNGRKDASGRRRLEEVGREMRLSGKLSPLRTIARVEQLGADYAILPDVRLLDEARCCQHIGLLLAMMGRGSRGKGNDVTVTELEDVLALPGVVALNNPENGLGRLQQFARCVIVDHLGGEVGW